MEVAQHVVNDEATGLPVTHLVFRTLAPSLDKFSLEQTVSELRTAIATFVAEDPDLRAQIEQRITEAFKGINVAAIVTKVCTEIALEAAKHAMARAREELGSGVQDVLKVNPAPSLEKQRK